MLGDVSLMAESRGHAKDDLSAGQQFLDWFCLRRCTS
jgi:hypothetical protein